MRTVLVTGCDTGIGREFARRTQGYGHPAIEPARKGLGKALQRAYREAAPTG